MVIKSLYKVIKDLDGVNKNEERDQGIEEMEL